MHTHLINVQFVGIPPNACINTFDVRPLPCILVPPPHVIAALAVALVYANVSWAYGWMRTQGWFDVVCSYFSDIDFAGS